LPLELFRKKKAAAPANLNDRGFLVFHSTSEVIAAERLLKSKGWKISVKGPPPEIRTGCDLVIEFPLMEELNILRVLRENNAPPIKAVPVTDPLLEPVDLFKMTDYGKFLMVRAANMKICIDKGSRLIVNISGGGCPDVPYLAWEMVGKTLEEAPDPAFIGRTLCGYALQLAFEEGKRLCSR